LKCPVGVFLVKRNLLKILSSAILVDGNSRRRNSDMDSQWQEKLKVCEAVRIWRQSEKKNQNYQNQYVVKSLKQNKRPKLHRKKESKGIARLVVAR
jgi:hypothetical protein